jgi:2-polyprenyl-6-methoxyphenol hydroxylase-like FAD-dependent oxidoreductase
MSAAKFKAIIIGGGPVGLTAAHIFNKAGIDFVLLEKGKTTYPDLGASLALWPQSLRILDQLDILETLRPHMNYLGIKHYQTLDGNVFRDSKVVDYAEDM